MPPLRRLHRRQVQSPPPEARTQAPSSDATFQAPSSDTTLGGRQSSPVRAESRPNAFCTMSNKDFLTRSGRMKAQEEEDGTLMAILKRAAFVKRGIDLWVNIPMAVNVGSAMELLEFYERVGEESPFYNETEKKKAERTTRDCKNKHVLYKAYRGMLDLFADFEDYFGELSKPEREELWVRIKKAADAARNTDTGSVKRDVHKYILKKGQPDPSLEEDKSTRGINHPQILRMIVPMSTLHAHGSDEDFEDMVKAKKYLVDNRSVPAFMYDVDAHDPSTPLEGLLRGHYPVRVFKHIFLGPSSALAGPGERGRTTQRGNAELAGQSECTPAMIAYACVQARFHISRRKVFGIMDGEFNISKFYYDVISILENKESEWVSETLSWWNRQIFSDGEGDEDEGEEDVDEIVVDDETSFANILAIVNDQALPIQNQPTQSQTQDDSQYDAHTFADLYA